MHVGIDQAGQQCISGHVDDFDGVETRQQVSRCPDSDNAILPNGDRAILDIADARAGHRQEV
jgi:hypothetical protein